MPTPWKIVMPDGASVGAGRAGTAATWLTVLEAVPQKAEQLLAPN
jgi:hypothetical protein